jgi:hypothetical protein
MGNVTYLGGLTIDGGCEGNLENRRIAGNSGTGLNSPLWISNVSSPRAFVAALTGRHVKSARAPR